MTGPPGTATARRRAPRRRAYRQNGPVTGDGLLPDAVAELYSSDPDEFVQRRGLLAARARAAGQAPVAKRIGGLRKPTRSAWVVNQLVRADPRVASELAGLGDELRAAQGSLDGEAIRDLSVRRRQLIEALARQAFTVSGQHSPAAGLRDEVTATLGAALADPKVAEQLAAGTLERAVRGEGFGPSGEPALTLVTSPGGRRASGSGDAARRPAVKAPPRPAEQASVERERRRQAALAAAEQAVAEAAQAAEDATAAELRLQGAVRQMEEQLADARQHLADARLRARRARSRQRHARLALDRLQKQ